MAQSVARRLGKAEVGGSSPLDSFEPSPESPVNAVLPGFFLFQQIRDADLQIFIDSNRNLIADFPIGLRV